MLNTLLKLNDLFYCCEKTNWEMKRIYIVKYIGKTEWPMLWKIIKMQFMIFSEKSFIYIKLCNNEPHQYSTWNLRMFYNHGFFVSYTILSWKISPKTRIYADVYAYIYLCVWFRKGIFAPHSTLFRMGRMSRD